MIRLINNNSQDLNHSNIHTSWRRRAFSRRRSWPQVEQERHCKLVWRFRLSAFRFSFSAFSFALSLLLCCAC